MGEAFHEIDAYEYDSKGVSGWKEVKTQNLYQWIARGSLIIFAFMTYQKCQLSVSLSGAGQEAQQ